MFIIYELFGLILLFFSPIIILIRILLGKEDIIINGKNYLVDHFKLKSKNENLPKNKKLDFDIWYNAENNLILKVSYSRMGEWEYRLKNFE